MGSALMPIEGLFLLLASIQAQIIVKGIRRNETATIKTVRKKPLSFMSFTRLRLKRELGKYYWTCNN